MFMYNESNYEYNFISAQFAYLVMYLKNENMNFAIINE